MASILSSCQHIYAVAPHIKELDYATRSYVREMSEKYGVSCSGSGGAMMNEISSIYYAFEIVGDFDIPRARVLHLKIMNELVDRIKKHQPIHKYITTYPDVEKVVSVHLFFANPDGHIHDYPKLGVVSSSKGNICFSSYYTDGRGWRTIKEETYQEAMEIVAKSYLLETGSDGLDSQVKSTEKCSQDSN